MFRSHIHKAAERNTAARINSDKLTETNSYCKYVLSTVGVSKESISKFLIGNRFHGKLRILSPENCKQSLRVKS